MESLLLRRGITGFFLQGDHGKMPHFCSREFKHIVHTAAASHPFIASAFVESGGLVPNFHSAQIRYDRHFISILGHSIYPILAFSEPVDLQLCSLRFINAASIAREILRLFPNVTIASAQDLGRSLMEADLSALYAVERQQIKYWKPKTVGEVVFNWWD